MLVPYKKAISPYFGGTFTVYSHREKWQHQLINLGGFVLHFAKCPWTYELEYYVGGAAKTTDQAVVYG